MFISLDEIDALLDETDATHQEKQTISFILAHENYPATYRGEKGYRVEFGGKYVGLGQFDRATWVNVTGKDFKYAMDPLSSLQGILQLVRSNERVFNNQFDDRLFTKEIAYLYHNQGAGAAASYLRTNKLRWPQQSDKAKNTFATAYQQFGETA